VTLITKQDFMDWKSLPVTKAVFAEIADMIEIGKEELSHLAGENSISDRERVGKLNGLRTLLGISFYDLEEEETNVD
jgi:hypothetical protein